MTGNVEIPAADMQAPVTTDFLLGQIALDLYRMADEQPPVLPLAMPVIAAPEIVTAVLRDEGSFNKEYQFLEMLAQGRFSANGSDWRRRVPLTQPSYRTGADVVSEAEIEAVYAASLQRRRTSMGPTLFQCFLDAAVAVMARAFGLSAPLPWPAESVADARANLLVPLCYSLCGHASRSSADICHSLAGFFSEIESLWMATPEVRGLLEDLRRRAVGIEGFNPVGELIQNVMAASETTASALLWAVEAGARFEAEPAAAAPFDLDRFLDEVLRVFPPIPLVIRRCAHDTTVAGMRFEADHVFAISFVGMHCHRSYWSEPLRFDAGRPEWNQPAASRPAFQPFSTGPRLCGGARLAHAELRAGLRAFRRLFRVEPLKAPLAIQYGLTSRPTERIDQFVHPADSPPA